MGWCKLHYNEQTKLANNTIRLLLRAQPIISELAHV